MSFVRTLATLAVGYAAAKGYDKFREMGGMQGMSARLNDPDATAEITGQIGQMMERMGLPNGQKQMQDMLARLGSAAEQGSGTAAAGLGNLMTALTGAAAAGTSAATQMFDGLTGAKTTDAMEAQARLMIRAMIEAAKADGTIDDEERGKILAAIQGSGETEVAYVKALIDAPPDMAGLVAETQDTMKAQVYAVSASAIRVDSRAEAVYLDALRRALGLSEETVAEIDRGMGRTGA